MAERPPIPGSGTIAYAQAEDLAGVRAFVSDYATGWGLKPDRVDLLILAISELVTNTLQHAGGGGRVHVWLNGGHVVCDVVDAAPAGSVRLGQTMPTVDAVRGRGLAIVERVCDAVEVLSATDGTGVRVRMSL
jgi:serine/threonine-protein kinase RsbW